MLVSNRLAASPPGQATMEPSPLSTTSSSSTSSSPSSTHGQFRRKTSNKSSSVVTASTHASLPSVVVRPSSGSLNRLLKMPDNSPLPSAMDLSPKSSEDGVQESGTSNSGTEKEEEIVVDDDEVEVKEERIEKEEEEEEEQPQDLSVKKRDQGCQTELCCDKKVNFKKRQIAIKRVDVTPPKQARKETKRKSFKSASVSTVVTTASSEVQTQNGEVTDDLDEDEEEEEPPPAHAAENPGETEERPRATNDLYLKAFFHLMIKMKEMIQTQQNGAAEKKTLKSKMPRVKDWLDRIDFSASTVYI